jgi:spermidine/putrescine transport system permease protein
VIVTLLVAPLGILVTYTFSSSRFFGGLEWKFTTAALRSMVSDPVVRDSAASSLRLGLTVAVLTLVVSFPTAYIMVFRLTPRARNVVMAALLISLLSNYLIRIYAWRSILGENGIINTGLIRLGVIDHALGWLLYSPTAVVMTLMQVFAPYVVLLLLASLENIPRDVMEAAQDLGSGFFARLVRVVFPIAAPGIVGAFLYTTILTAGDYITPQLVGNGRSLLMGKVIVDRFSLVGDWSGGAALSLLMLGGFLVLWILVTQATRLVVRWTT